MDTRLNPTGHSSARAQTVVECIFRYKTRFLVTFGVVISFFILFAFLSPRQYQSEMKILIQDARSTYQVPSGRTSGPTQQPSLTEERINSEIEVLRSRDVADQVIDPDWNSSVEKDKTASQMQKHARAVDQFSKQLKIDLLPKSNVIHVSYTASSATDARQTINRLLQSFLVRQHSLDRPTGTSSLFSSEQDQSKQDLDNAQQQLASFQQDHHIVSLSEKESGLEQQITELQQELRTTDVQISDLSDRVANGQKELQTLSQRQATQQKTVPNVFAMEQLSTMLASYRNQKTALLTKFPPTDRLVQEVDQQIVNTSEALRTASETQPSEKTTDVNPIWLQIRSAISQNSMDRSAAIARRRGLGTQLASLQAALVTTESSTVEFNTLQARVTELQGNYQLYTQKRTEAQFANALGQQHSLDVAIAESPTFSATPSNPKLTMVLPLGISASLLLALCSVFFSELGRDTIVSPWELEAITLAPVLATVPFIEADYLQFRDIPNLTPAGTAPTKSGNAKTFLESLRTPLATSFRSTVTGDLFTRLSSLAPNNKGSSDMASPSLTMSKGLSP